MVQPEDSRYYTLYIG